MALRELILGLKVKADKTAIDETDRAFASATRSGEKFEKATAEMLWPLKKVGEQLATNTKLAAGLAARLAAVRGAILPAGALPSSRAPEAPSNRLAREARDALGMADGPKAPTPGRAPVIKPVNLDDLVDRRSGATKALDAFRDTAQSAMSAAGGAVERFNARFDSTARFIFNARTALAGFVAVAAGTAVVHFVGSVVEAGAELHTMSQRTRLSVETLQVWRDVAKGVNADSGAVTGAFRKLSQAMTLAGRGGKTQAKAFKDLGVEIKGRNVEDVLIDTGAALANLDDDAKASALSVQLFGAQGAALVPAFKKGAAAVRQLTAELRDNVVMNAEEAARLEEVGSAVERGAKKWTALKTRAIVLLLPVIEAVANGFEKASKWILRMVKETASLQTILLAVTSTGLLRLVTLLGGWALSAIKARGALNLLGAGLASAARFAFTFLAPLLLIEDFLVFLAGGKSLFGRAFEEIFGPGGAQSVREGILTVLNEIKEVLSSSIITALTNIGNSELFKGAAKIAAEGVLAVLHAIGLALADNTTKAEALAAALKKNLQAMGLGPNEEERQKDIAAGLPENRKEGDGQGWGRKIATTIFGDPFADPNSAASQDLARNNAIMAKKRLELDGIVPTPAAPPQPKAAVTINDQRKLEVNVSAGATPGVVGREVAGSVDGAMTKDRRQTLNAL